MCKPLLPLGNRKGQAGLFVVLNLGVLLGAIGLAVDLGWSYFTKIRIQAAADAAAMAAVSFAAAGGPITCGSSGVTCGTTTTCDSSVTSASDSFSDGCVYAAANGYVNGGTTVVTMTGNSGTAQAPPGVSGNTPTYWAQATISTSPYTLFGPFSGTKQFTIKASSIAAVSYYSAGACVYVLDATANSALTINGSSSVTSSCGIFVNSSSNNALTTKGGASISATQILVNGGDSLASNSSVSPSPTLHAGSQSDPLATLAMPTVTSTCDHTNYSITSGGSATLSPGTYCDGITISGGNVTFNAGTYILNGGGMSVTGNAVISGSGVTFFNTGQWGHTVSAISTAGSATLTLSGPTSGTYKGMLFLQDRNLTYSGSNNISGSSSSVLTGSLYFPTTALQYSGSSTSGSYTALIGDTVTFTGTSTLKNDPTGTYTGLGTTVRGIIQ